MATPTERLSELGVSIWLDDLSRERIVSGGLASLIAERNVVGVTTNPTIFARALATGHSYAEQLAVLAEAGVDPTEAVFQITTDDVRAACDIFTPVYTASHGVDGRVSIEVAPDLARDTAGTIAEAERLWAIVDRPNAMIKIPATVEGIPAITEAIAAGISVNVTLIFSLERYHDVIDAYLTGLEHAQQNGHDLSAIESVASFFVSRVDTEVDMRLDAIGTPEAMALRSRAALANARLAYRLFEQEFSSGRAQALLAAGAHRQRPLWASTGVKDPTLPDTRYVIDLAVDGVVNTMPEQTLDAVYDHGIVVGDTVRPGYAAAEEALAAIAAVGVDLDDVTTVLEEEGVDKFVISWLELLDTVGSALEAAR